MKAKVLKPSWARQLELFPGGGPKPAAPCGQILKFQPRTEVMSIRMPQELAELVEYEAAHRYMSRSTLMLRIVSEWAMRQEYRQGFQGKHSEAA